MNFKDIDQSIGNIRLKLYSLRKNSKHMKELF